jgi:hypothetical protein
LTYKVINKIRDISDRYQLAVGDSELSTPVHKTYKIVNKITNVCEAEVTVYSRAVALGFALDDTASEADLLFETKSIAKAGKILFDLGELEAGSTVN